MLPASWEVTGHQKKAAENTGQQPVEMGKKGVLEGDSRKKWDYSELFWGGFPRKRTEKSWGKRSH